MVLTRVFSLGDALASSVPDAAFYGCVGALQITAHSQQQKFCTHKKDK